MPLGIEFLVFGIIALIIGRLIRLVRFETAVHDSEVMAIVSALLIATGIIVIITS
jgi:hypothetical protein